MVGAEYDPAVPRTVGVPPSGAATTVLPSDDESSCHATSVVPPPLATAGCDWSGSDVCRAAGVLPDSTAWTQTSGSIDTDWSPVSVRVVVNAATSPQPF